MAHRDNWGGSGHRQPDITLLTQPNRIGEHHATVGAMAPNAMNNDTAMMKYMKDDRFFPYFGFANKMVPPANTYGQQDEENYVLPDAYTGSNVYLRNIIISQVQQTEMWGTSVALPWKKQEGSMEIAWDQWHFNDTMMTRTPEEAVPRLLTSHFESFKSYTVRFGIALIMEHGFWKSEKGQQQYALQLIQIRNAIAFTAQYGVTLALLNPPVYVDDNEKYLIKSTHRSKNQINNWFQEEIDEFAILNKTEDGWLTELGRLDDKLKRRNQTTGDMIIVPSSAARYVRNRPENKWHFLSGGIRKFDRSELTTGDGRMVVESIMHKMGEHQASQDPTYREVVIGGFFHMLGHHLNTVPLEKFKTCMLDTLIYCEEKDDMYKMSYALCVQTLGLFDNGKDACKKGHMPLTTHLGVKVFEGANTWGEVYKTAGRLDMLVKQLNGKDEDTYRDFVEKFIGANEEERPKKISPNADDEVNYTMSDDDEPEASADPDVDSDGEERKSSDRRRGGSGIEGAEGQTSSANDVSTALLQLKLHDDRHENEHGHRARLQTMLNWLTSLDSEAKKVGIKSDIAAQVSQFLAKNKSKANKLNGEVKATFVYELAWKKAQELLILYGLEVATREHKSGATAFEQYVLNSTLSKSNGGIGSKDDKALRQLNEESPYWRPAGESAIVTEVELVAPEPGAGDNGGSVKRLAYPTNAFTLSSSFLVLFNIGHSNVHKMLQASESAGENPNKTLFNISFNWNKTSQNQQQLLQRAGLMQISIMISAFYATLSAACSKSYKSVAEESKAYTNLAKDWIKLGVPVHMLTGSRDSFSTVIEQAKGLFTLDYQAPIDTLVCALRDALFTIYESNGEINTDSVIQLIKACEVQFKYVQQNVHTRSAGAIDINSMQGETGFGLNEPLMHAFLSHPDYMATFTHERRNPRVRETEEAHRKRVEQLAPKVKALKEMLAAQRKVKGNEVPKDKDQSPHWKPTYIKLMGELPKEIFKNVYLPVNEAMINHQDAPSFKAKMINDIQGASADPVTLKLVAKMANTAEPLNQGVLDLIKDNVDAAIKHMKDNPADFRIDPTAVALEWTRLWSTKKTAMAELAQACIDPGTKEVDTTRLYIAVVVSAAMSRMNLMLLRKEAKDHWKGASDVVLNETYPQMFLNSRDGSNLKAADAPEPIVTVNDGHGGVKSRITTDALRNFLLTELPITDGYFWKWCIEHDVIPAIGMLGFRHAKRYEAGTIIILSAWGQTGNTFYGHADMMLSDNAATKMHYGHFTYYSKSQVLQPRKIIHGRNCVVKDYLGGNGHKIWDASDPDDQEDYNQGELTKDIFMVPVLMNHDIDTNHMDMTGRYHVDIGAGEEANKATHYDSAAIYSAYIGDGRHGSSTHKSQSTMTIYHRALI